MLDPNLFHGIAVVIDDQIRTDGENIRTIQQQIENAGCHVIGMTAIPDDPHLATLGGASFFIVDWNLAGQPFGNNIGGDVRLPERLKGQYIADMVAFLKKLKNIRVAPVFVFTNEAPAEVTDELKKHAELFVDSDPSHILVKSKAEVIGKGIFNVLSEWLQQAPSAYVLKRWESEYERAKNQMFLDFYNKSVFWPLLLKKTFEEDDVPPSVALGELIGRNLLSRMTPFEFDLESFDTAFVDSLEKDEQRYRTTLLNVLEGERFLPSDRLHVGSIAPGDIFKDGKSYYVNIRPECDCIARKGQEQDDVELYLLRGSKLSSGQVKVIEGYGQLEERDTNASIFAMKDGESFSFQFSELHKKPWKELKDKRVGRLLAPFLTRLQQRYAAYLQRPGMPRIPTAALPPTPAKAVEPSASAPSTAKEEP
jgi:hypothetical protein